jgi:hypothetical protein
MDWLKNLLPALCILCLLVASFSCRKSGYIKEELIKLLAVEANLEQESDIKIGQEMIIKSESLKIVFASIENDSRCPANVNCFWEGDAEVVLNVSKVGSSSEGTTINLHANRKFVQSAKYQQYEIKLVFLDRENVARIIVKKR